MAKNKVQKKEDIEAEFKEEPVVEKPKEEKSMLLLFSGSGWCEKLNKSYRKGAKVCSSQKEYDALKPFSDNK